MGGSTVPDANKSFLQRPFGWLVFIKYTKIAKPNSFGKVALKLTEFLSVAVRNGGQPRFQLQGLILVGSQGKHVQNEVAALHRFRALAVKFWKKRWLCEFGLAELVYAFLECHLSR